MESRVGVYPRLHRGQRRRSGEEAVFLVVFLLLIIATPTGLDRSHRRCDVVVLTFFGAAPYLLPFRFPQQVIYTLLNPRSMRKQKFIHHQLLPAPSARISKTLHELVELRVHSLDVLLVHGS